MNYDDLGKRIRTLRKKQGMTQEQLAKEAGMSPSFIGHIERGTRKVSLDTLSELAAILGVSGSELMKDALLPVARDDGGRAAYRIGSLPAGDGMLRDGEGDLMDSYLDDEKDTLQQTLLREIISLLDSRD